MLCFCYSCVQIHNNNKGQSTLAGFDELWKQFDIVVAVIKDIVTFTLALVCYYQIEKWEKHRNTQHTHKPKHTEKNEYADTENWDSM